MRSTMLALGVLVSTGWMVAGCAMSPDAPVADSAQPARTEVVVDRVARTIRVGAEDITRYAAPEDRLQLAANESFQLPQPGDDNRLPGYPPELLSQGLPDQVVCLRLSIDEAGRVMDSAPVVDSPDCLPEPQNPGFYEAARRAVSTWRFDPAFRCIHANVEAKRRSGATCRRAREIPTAVSLAYRFEFQQRDGRGEVRVQDGS